MSDRAASTVISTYGVLSDHVAGLDPRAWTREPAGVEAARDRREGQDWTASQRIKNDAIYAIASVALAIASILPATLARAAARAIAAIAWVAVPSARHIAIANIRATLPDLDATELARSVYRNLGRRLGEAVVSLRVAPPALEFVPGSRAVLDDAIAEGNGVVFASAHLGPWEQVASSLVAHGIPLTAVAREPYDPRFARIYARLRRNVPTVYRAAEGAGVALVRVLRKGGVLGIPMDLASRVESVEAPFLDRPARTPVGPARLAIRTGAAVVVGTATPDGLHFVRIDKIGCEKVLTTRINMALSARILAWPEAWLWVHKRWT